MRDPFFGRSLGYDLIVMSEQKRRSSLTPEQRHREDLVATLKGGVIVTAIVVGVLCLGVAPWLLGLRDIARMVKP